MFQVNLYQSNCVLIIADLTAHARTERTGHTPALAFGGLADWKILCGG